MATHSTTINKDHWLLLGTSLTSAIVYSGVDALVYMGDKAPNEKSRRGFHLEGGQWQEINNIDKFGGSLWVKSKEHLGNFTYTIDTAGIRQPAPSVIDLSANTIKDNAAGGDTIGLLSTDTTGVTFSLASDPSGFMDIEGDNLTIALDGTPVKGNYDIKVTASNEAGFLTQTFTILVEAADVAPEPTPDPTLEPAVISTGGGISGAGGGDTLTTDTTTMLAFFSMPLDPITPNTTYVLNGSGTVGNTFIRVQSDGTIRAEIPYHDGATTGKGVINLSPSETPSGLGVQPGDEIGVLIEAGVGAANGAISINGKTPFVEPTGSTYPTTAKFDVGGQTWRVGESTGTGSKVQELSFVGVWAGAALATGTITDKLSAVMSPTGRAGDITTITNTFGTPRVAIYGAAADYTPGLMNKGSGTNFTAAYEAATFKDVTLETPGLSLTVNPDTELLAGTAAATFHTFNDEALNSNLSTRLSITADRTSIVTGEAVFLKIDGLTEQEAATWGIVWEFETKGEFKHLTNLPWHMRQKNRALGWQQMVVWDTPGIKAVRVRVQPPKWLGIEGTVLTINITNRDPEVEFETTTWAIDPSGTGTIPAGATRVADYPAAVAALEAAGKGRILFPRGATTGLGGKSGKPLATGGFMYDAWGIGADPIIDVSAGGFSFTGATAIDFILIKNLNFVGNVATDKNTKWHPDAWKIASNANYTFNGCNFEKMHTAIVQEPGATYAGFNVAIWDCRIGPWQRYGMYMTNPERFMMRGCKFEQSPLAISGPGTIYPLRNGPIRLAKISNSRVIISQMDMFSSTGWTLGSTQRSGTERPYSIQALIRYGAEHAENSKALLNEIWGEGYIDLAAGGGYPVHGAAFIVCHSNYVLANSSNSGGGVNIGHTGLWLRDNMFVFPDTNREDQSDAKVIGFNERPKEVTDLWHTKKFYIFNNTIAWMYTAANHGRLDGTNIPSYKELFTPDLTLNSTVISSTGALPEMIQVDNLFWNPNMTLTNETGPLVPNGIRSIGTWGPAPKYPGKRNWLSDAVTQEFDTTTATPATGAILVGLATTSTLLGTASTANTVAAFDFGGQYRAEVHPGALGVNIYE